MKQVAWSGILIPLPIEAVAGSARRITQLASSPHVSPQKSGEIFTRWLRPTSRTPSSRRSQTTRLPTSSSAVCLSTPPIPLCSSAVPMRPSRARDPRLCSRQPHRRSDLSSTCPALPNTNDESTRLCASSMRARWRRWFWPDPSWLLRRLRSILSSCWNGCGQTRPMGSGFMFRSSMAVLSSVSVLSFWLSVTSLPSARTRWPVRGAGPVGRTRMQLESQICEPRARTHENINWSSRRSRAHWTHIARTPEWMIRTSLPPIRCSIWARGSAETWPPMSWFACHRSLPWPVHFTPHPQCAALLRRRLGRCCAESREAVAISRALSAG